MMPSATKTTNIWPACLLIHFHGASELVSSALAALSMQNTEVEEHQPLSADMSVQLSSWDPLRASSRGSQEVKIDAVLGLVDGSLVQAPVAAAGLSPRLRGTARRSSPVQPCLSVR